MALPELPEIPEEDIDHYLDESPLLFTLLAFEEDDNKINWYNQIGIAYGKFQEELEQKFGEQKNHLQIIASVMAGVHEIFTNDRAGIFVTTTYLIGIGYEVKEPQGAEYFLPNICKQLIDTEWVNPSVLDSTESKRTLLRVVRGCLNAGATLRALIDGKMPGKLPDSFTTFFDERGD